MSRPTSFLLKHTIVGCFRASSTVEASLEAAHGSHPSAITTDRANVVGLMLILIDKANLLHDKGQWQVRVVAI